MQNGGTEPHTLNHTKTSIRSLLEIWQHKKLMTSNLSSFNQEAIASCLMSLTSCDLRVLANMFHYHSSSFAVTNPPVKAQFSKLCPEFSSLRRIPFVPV